MSGLVTGLQNQVQRFESACDLPKSDSYIMAVALFFHCLPSINTFRLFLISGALTYILILIR